MLEHSVENVQLIIHIHVIAFILFFFSYLRYIWLFVRLLHLKFLFLNFLLFFLLLIIWVWSIPCLGFVELHFESGLELWLSSSWRFWIKWLRSFLVKELRRFWINSLKRLVPFYCLLRGLIGCLSKSGHCSLITPVINLQLRR